MEEVLIAAHAPFSIEVPYKLVETGAKGKKPLIIYLHGYKQNMEYFRKKMKPLLKVRAFHLFIQGPYPVYDESHSRKVKDWGRAWYLYDGEQDQFIKSMELASEFIQSVIDTLLNNISVSRVALIGYSMGGYLAGYFALSRWKYLNELVVIGGRIKTEVFRERDKHYGHLNVLALHGSKDESVLSSPQKESAEELRGWGANVDFKELEAGHALGKQYVLEIEKWLLSTGYRQA